MHVSACCVCAHVYVCMCVCMHKLPWIKGDYYYNNSLNLIFILQISLVKHPIMHFNNKPLILCIRCPIKLSDNIGFESFYPIISAML